MHRLPRLARKPLPLRLFGSGALAQAPRPKTSLDFARHYPETKLTTLSNGIRVATEEGGSGDSATVGIFIDAGSRYESKKNSGVAHFLEHLTFKGTKKRSRVQLESEMENMGGHLNAYTSRESTVFYAKVLKGDIPQALDILADMIQKSELTNESIEAERSVILREMKEIEKNLEETIFDHLHATAYRGSSLSQTILGPKENILSINRDDILNYIKTHYTADRMIVAAAGAVEHDQIVKLSEELFKNIPAPRGDKPVIKEPARFLGSDRLISYETWDTAHVAIAYPTGGWNDPDTFPLMVAQQLLGNWDKESAGSTGPLMSSKLVSYLAKEDLANSVMTFNTQYSDSSLFGVYVVAHPVGLQRTIYHVLKSITHLAHEVDEAQLESAKNQVKYQILANLDGSTSIAEDIGRQLLCYGRRIHPAEQIARIEAVDANSVKNAALRFFYDRDHACAAMGHLWELPDYIDRRRRSYWLRF